MAMNAVARNSIVLVITIQLLCAVHKVTGQLPGKYITTTELQTTFIDKLPYEERGDIQQITYNVMCVFKSCWLLVLTGNVSGIDKPRPAFVPHWQCVRHKFMYVTTLYS